MSVDLINSVKKIIHLGKGDPGRLEYILDMLTNDKILPLSDQKYLENMISFYLEEKNQEPIEGKNERAIDLLHSEIQSINQRLVNLERRGFERYIGKKAILFFVTVFVGWNALEPFIAPFLNFFLSYGMIEIFFPLNSLIPSFNSALVQFVFAALMYAWLFIGFIYLARFIKSRKIAHA